MGDLKKLSLEELWFSEDPLLETGTLPKDKLPHLLATLSVLRALQWNYWGLHWRSQGAVSYSDHLLFSELYKNLEPEIDDLAEKIVAAYTSDAICPLKNMRLALVCLEKWSEEPNFYKQALRAEMHFQNLLETVYYQLERSEVLTLGMDALLSEIANKHETHIYLLKQRLKATLI